MSARKYPDNLPILQWDAEVFACRSSAKKSLTITGPISVSGPRRRQGVIGWAWVDVANWPFGKCLAPYYWSERRKLWVPALPSLIGTVIDLRSLNHELDFRGAD